MAQTKKRKRQPLTQAQLCALHPVGRLSVYSLGIGVIEFDQCMKKMETA